MYNWTKVFARYCDGGSQIGDVEEPITGRNPKPIYYRGRRVLAAQMQELVDSWGLLNATDVVYSGCSAGGLSAFVSASLHPTPP